MKAAVTNANDPHAKKEPTLILQFFLSAIRPTLGVLSSVLAAIIWTKLFSGSPVGQYAPIVFVLVLLVVAALCGAMASVVGAVLSAAVFAYSLYPPLGSLRIESAGAREGISWMLLTALVISFLLFPPKRKRPTGH